MKLNWAENELRTVNLSDQRLNKRCAKILTSFANSPVSPINQACGDWSETKAAYRFFKNDKVNYQKITKGHQEATTARTDGLKTILAIQDTTYLTYTKHPKTSGLCPLTRNNGKHKKVIPTLGLIMHSTIAVDCDGTPLGICNQKIYSRPQLSDEKKKLKKISHNVALPIKDKDSYKWIGALEQTVDNFSERSKDIVTICDREADIYDLFLRANELNTHLLVRACKNRKVNKKSTYSEKTGQYLWTLLKNKGVKGKVTIDIPKRDKTPARKAICLVKYSSFVLNFPKNHFDKNTRKLPNLKLYAVYIHEINNSGTDSIEWMLLTTLPITSFQLAMEKLKWYCFRWRIETWHKILKSGLRVEDCRLSTSQRLIKYLSIMSIVGWRILWITLISRVTPETSCYIFLNKIEWKILFRKFKKGHKIPKKEPTVNQCVRWIGQLGGFLGRKKDKEPGIIYIWRGLKYFHAMVDAVGNAQGIYG